VRRGWLIRSKENTEKYRNKRIKGDRHPRRWPQGIRCRIVGGTVAVAHWVTEKSVWSCTSGTCQKPTLQIMGKSLYWEVSN